MSAIQWGTNFSITEDAAVTEKKGIMIDVHDPDSIACRQLEKETYANKEVVGFINDNFEPYRVDSRKESVVENYYFDWAPTLIFLDRLAREVHRSVGYLGPEDFHAVALLALGKADLCNGNHDGARYHFEKVLKDYPRSGQGPEALYYLGLNRYRATGDLKELGKGAERLREKFPDSIWARKAEPYLMELREAAV
jgi:hypothetical protein